MRPVFVVTQLAVTLVLGALAYVVLRARPRDTANRAFAAYLSLVGLNYLLVALYYLNVDGSAPFEGQPVLPRTFLVVANVVGVVDPIALAYFVLSYPARSRARRAWAVGLAIPASVIAIGTLVVPDAFIGQRSGGRLLLELDVMLAYLALFTLVAVREFRTGAKPPVPRGLLFGLALIVLFRIGPALDPSLRVGWGLDVAPEWWEPRAIALNLLVSLVALALAWASLRAVARPSARGGVDLLARRVGAWCMGLSALLAIGPLVVALLALPSDRPGVGSVLVQLSVSSHFSIRWFGFAALAGPAFLHNQVFELDVRLRRLLIVATASGVMMLVFVGGIALLQQDALQGGRVGIDTFLAIGFLLLAASQSVRWARRLADRVFPPEAERMAELRRVRRYEMYRDAARAAANGTLPRADLDSIAVNLGLDEAERRVALATATQGTRRGCLPGDIVASRYELLRVVGQGGHGRVFEARDLRDRRTVALKELDVADGRGLALVEREVLAGSKLDHPNVVRALDFVAVDGFVGVVSDLVDGSSLADRMRARGPLSIGEARALLLDVLDGLSAAHARGIVHRDVKPANILLDASGRARIADFGVALVPEMELTADDARVALVPGTRRYLPPEAFGGGDPTPSWDVFAAAKVFEDAIGGERALEALPASDRTTIERALSADLRRRFKDATSFRAALQ